MENGWPYQDVLLRPFWKIVFLFNWLIFLNLLKLTLYRVHLQLSIDIHCRTHKKCFTWTGSATPRMPDYSITGFLLPWWHWHIARWKCYDSQSSHCERVFQGHETSFSHIGDLEDVQEKAWWKINVTLGEIHSFDLAEAYWNSECMLQADPMKY